MDHLHSRVVLKALSATFVIALHGLEEDSLASGTLLQDALSEEADVGSYVHKARSVRNVRQHSLDVCHHARPVMLRPLIK
jgi:hypothetical protein